MQSADRRTLLTALIVFFYISHLTRFISQVFVLNFSTSGLNETVLLVLLFLSGFPLYILERLGRLPKFNLGVVLVIIALNVISLIDNSVVAVLASLIAMAVLLIPLYSYSGAELRDGIGLGIAFVMLFQTVFSGLNPYATLLTKAIFLVLNIDLIIFFLWNRPATENFGDYSNRRLSLVQSFLLVAALFVAYPFVVAAWTNEATSVLSLLTGRSPASFQQITPVLMSISAIAGILIAISIELPSTIDQISTLAFTGILALLLLYPIFPVILYGLLTVTLVRALPNEPNVEESRLSLWFFFLQFVLLILLFLHVTAGHWVFLPSIIHPMLRGQAWFYLTLISFTASTFALMEVRS